MNRIIFILLFGLGALLSACDNMVSDVDIDPGKPKFVVHSYLSPDQDTITLHLAKSQPLYTSRYYNQPVSVPDAKVEISHLDKTVLLQYDALMNRYWTTELNIRKGESYSLRVTSATGEILTSKCSVPSKTPPEIEDFKISQPSPAPEVITISFRFKDYQGSGDFYRVFGIYKFQYDPWTEYAYVDQIPMRNGEEFVTDQNQDGTYFSYNSHQFYVDAYMLESSIFMMITDEHYYHYHVSTRDFEGDNVFSEPTPVYTNIRGGLGVFSAYISEEIPLTL